MKKLSCKVAQQINAAEFLDSLGYQPKKIRNQDYWYYSPFRDEKLALLRLTGVEISGLISWKEKVAI